MRLTTPVLIILPALAAARQQQQIPLVDTLQSWFEKAKAYLPAAATAPILSTTTSAKKAAAAITITPLTEETWQSVLSPPSSPLSSGPETWMIFVSGNKTCYGQCAGLESAWNETAAIFAAEPTSVPKLGYINCDTSPVLCAIWYATPPSVWHVQLPQQAAEATTVHIVPLNSTTTTARDLVKVHTTKTYEKTPVYEGVFHPFDGLLARFGIAKPVGYVLYGFGLMPSWAVMIGISFISRNLM